MAPRRCIGFQSGDPRVTVSCMFSTNEGTPGVPAHGNFGGRCVWCNPEEIQRRCGNQRLRKLLVHSLRRLGEINSVKSEVFATACARLPLEWAQEVREAASPAEPMMEQAREEEPYLQLLVIKTIPEKSGLTSQCTGRLRRI